MKPNLIEKTLSNGFELLIYPTSSPVVSTQVWVDVGSIDETSSEAGFCHFLEHMLFKGTPGRTTKDIAGSVESSGGEMNAFTSYEHTVYYITIGATRWKLAQDILSDMLLNSSFLAKEFYPEQEVILEEIKRGEDSPGRQLYRGAYEICYGKQGYGRPVIGYPKTVKACTHTQLKKFWQKWYSPALMTMVVCGNVDPLEVEKSVLRSWGKVQKKAMRKRRREIGFESRLTTPSHAPRKMDPFAIHSIRWVGSYPALSITSPELPALDFISMMLAQGESSRLHQTLFRDKQLVTHIHAGVWSPIGNGLTMFDVETPTEKGGAFRKAFLEEIERFSHLGPTREEFDRVQTLSETERIYNTQTAEGLANRLGHLKTSTGRALFDFEYNAKAKELSLLDIRTIAQEFLNPSQLREFALVPKDFKESLWEKEKKFDVGVTSRKKKLQTAPSHQFVSLSNGIQLALFPRADSPIMHFQACALGGLRFEKKLNAGIGNLFSESWECGPQGMTTPQFTAYLEKHASTIDSFSGRNSFGLSCTTLTRYVDQILPLYIKTLFHPQFDTEEFQRIRNVALEDIKTQEDDLARFCSRLFFQTLFEDHPYAYPIVGLRESVEKIKISDIKTHFRSSFEEQPFIIGIAGNFSPQSMIETFESIERKNVQELKPAIHPLHLTPPKAPRWAEVKKGREQSHIIHGFLGIQLNQPERFALKILLNVLGGQSGRLFMELRDKKSLCYTVSPLAFEGIERGYIGVYIGCDPRKRDEALSGIKEELNKLVEHGISKKEFTRAKEYILGKHLMDLQLNAALANAGALQALYGLKYDEHLHLEEMLNKVHLDQIQSLAHRLFTQPSVTAVII